MTRSSQESGWHTGGSQQVRAVARATLALGETEVITSRGRKDQGRSGCR